MVCSAAAPAALVRQALLAQPPWKGFVEVLEQIEMEIVREGRAMAVEDGYR
jgi:hypothetical protein